MQAVLTLFELATLDNWGDAMFATMDITGLNKQPSRNAQWQNSIFFVVFVCVSAQLMIKSFVAVFCEQVLPSMSIFPDIRCFWCTLLRFIFSRTLFAKCLKHLKHQVHSLIQNRQM